MNMCTSLWHTSARCYTLLAFCRLDTDAPTSAPIGTSQWFPSLGAWTHLWRLFANAHLFQRCPGSFHISANSAFNVFETCNFFGSNSPFDLRYRAKLWHFEIFFWMCWSIFGGPGGFCCHFYFFSDRERSDTYFPKMHIHQIIGTSHWFLKMDTCTKHTTHGSCHILTLEPLPFFTQAAMELPKLVLISFPCVED